MVTKSGVIAGNLILGGFLVLMGLVLPIDAFCQESLDPSVRTFTSQQNQNPVTSSGSNSATDPQVKKIIEQMDAMGILHPTTLSQAEKAYLFYTTLSGPPEKVFRVDNRDVSGPSSAVPIRIYYPNEGRKLPAWVFFHGGGFVAGNLDTHDAVLRAVTNRCNCVVISVAYRLAPEHPFPAAPDDCYAATKWVSEHAMEIGVDPERIAVGGDGAGGNLAAVVALMARDLGGPHLSYQVLIYPILDAAMSTKSWIESTDPLLTSDAMLAKLSAYVPISPQLANPLANPRISPSNAANLKGLPPVFIISDDNDPLQDEDLHYADDLRHAGVPVELSRYPNVIHGFFLMGGELDAGKKSIEQVSEVLRQVLANK